jgi:hypothetical protein
MGASDWFALFVLVAVLGAPFSFWMAGRHLR